MLLSVAFLLGLASTFHCVGMCGPISLALPLDRSSSLSILSGLVQYHLGRIITYSLLGLLIGSIGFSLQLFRVLQWLSIVMGVVMIVLAWKRQWIHKLELRNNFLMMRVTKGMGSMLASDSPLKFPALGALNGLLPCGMVFVALGNALLSGTVPGAMAGMAAFGLGTFPAMILVGYFARQINATARQRINRAFPVLLTLVGFMLIIRGANLGIPYISPKMTELQQKTTDKPAQQVVIECHSSTKD